MKKIFSLMFVLTALVTALISLQVPSIAATDTQSPSTPTNLRAIEITDSIVRLRWTPSYDNVDVEGYEVYMNGSRIGRVSSAGARVSKLSQNTTYTFKVRAFDEEGNKSYFSPSLTLKTLGSDYTLYPPENLAVSEVAETYIRVTWDAPTNDSHISHYGVYLNNRYLGKVESTRARITKLKANTLYNIKVVSMDTAGNKSVASNYVAAITLADSSEDELEAPANLKSVEVTQDIIRIKWDATNDSDDVIGYYIYMNDKIIGAVSGTAARIRNLTPETEYKFYVVAYNAKTVSEPSTSLRIETSPTDDDDEIITAPSNLRAIELTQSSVRLRWDASEGDNTIVGYIVYRNAEAMGTVQTTGAFINGLESGSTHQFKVVGFDNYGNTSTKSNLLVVTTLNS